MRCPKCDNPTTEVLETRDADRNTIRRRRECKACKTRFTTVEQVIREAGLYLSAEEYARMKALLDELLPLLGRGARAGISGEVPGQVRRDQSGRIGPQPVSELRDLLAAKRE